MSLGLHTHVHIHAALHVNNFEQTQHAVKENRLKSEQLLEPRFPSPTSQSPSTRKPHMLTTCTHYRLHQYQLHGNYLYNGNYRRYNSHYFRAIHLTPNWYILHCGYAKGVALASSLEKCNYMYMHIVCIACYIYMYMYISVCVHTRCT